MSGAANEDWLRILEADFLREHADCWTAMQAPEFSVVLVPAMDIPALAARILPELAARDLLASGPFWKFLMGFRVAVAKVFGWDPGLGDRKLQALESGKYLGFFHVLHVDAPREVGLTVQNRLTRAWISWVLRENPDATTVLHVTCGNFKSRQGDSMGRLSTHSTTGSSRIRCAS
jgi:hypothetical protein